MKELQIPKGRHKIKKKNNVVSSPEIQSGTLWTLDVSPPTRLVYLAGVDNFWKKEKKTNNNKKITSRDKRERVDALCVLAAMIYLSKHIPTCMFLQKWQMHSVVSAQALLIFF